VHPDSVFDVSLYDWDFSIATSRIWFLFAGYIFFLAFIYFVISRTKLKSKKWIVITHYTFILLFLVFFSVFLSFANPSVQSLIGRMPFSALITIYGVIFVTDVALFFLGIIFLLLELFSLRKNTSK
jgi:membrane-bound ClpP family serine protease